MVGLLDCSE